MRMLVIGDTHVASKFGLHSKRMLPRDDNECKGSLYLLKCLSHLVRNIDHIDVLVMPGDIIEGTCSKDDGTLVWTTSLGEQVQSAIEVFRPLMSKCDKIIRINGTPYHEGHHKALKYFDEAYDIEYNSDVYNLEFSGKKMNISHHPSGGGGMYEGSALSKEAVLSYIATAKGHVDQPRWIVRAHFHMYGYFQNTVSDVAFTPAFKLIDPYAIKKNYWKFHPDIGALLIERDKTQYSGMKFIPILYDTPKEKVLKIE